MKTILLAILGESPGVLTETLWELARTAPDQFPSEISILTTLRGREILKRQLAPRILPALIQKLRKEFQADLPLPRTTLYVFPSRDNLEELVDLQSREDVEDAGDLMLRWVRGFVLEENNRVIASISGGRKSMTSLLTTCMTLLGRPCDRMVHVHVPSPYDRPLKPPFLYPGQVKHHLTPEGDSVPGENVPITLIDMPFIPLQRLYNAYWGKSTASFSEMVRSFQNIMNPEYVSPVTLLRSEKRLIADENEIKLSEMDVQVLEQLWTRKLFPATWKEFADNLDPEDCRKAAERVRRKLQAAHISLPEIQRILPKFRGDPPPPQWPPEGLEIS
ncbi:MAG: TIGR02584 family CRISPR-associated protein [Verrucomicrobia bacterium]|nr:TIGR02584 family CRISPR-associated protein [Verrucomicrobiota bacterium]MCH8528791.1 TIGR02584 family CRISPR-associated protein [Kiritimatiellia bacterium]